MEHHIFNFETLGQNPFLCPVIDLSYFKIDVNRYTSVMEPYYFNDIVSEVTVIKFDVTEQIKKYGYILEESTIDWWKSQGSLAKERIRPSVDDVSLKTGMKDWINSLPLKNKGVLWSRRPTFHHTIADRIIRNIKIDSDKFVFWSARDIVTFIDSKFNFTTKTDFIPFSDEIKWNTLYNPYQYGHKIAADVMRLQTIARAEADLDIINS